MKILCCPPDLAVAARESGHAKFFRRQFLVSPSWAGASAAGAGLLNTTLVMGIAIEPRRLPGGGCAPAASFDRWPVARVSLSWKHAAGI